MNFPPDPDEGCTTWDFIADSLKSLGIAIACACAAVVMVAGGFEAWRLL